jgi:hypothetical protein
MKKVLVIIASSLFLFACGQKEEQVQERKDSLKIEVIKLDSVVKNDTLKNTEKKELKKELKK